MTLPIDQRIGYHPLPYGRFSQRSLRQVDKRLAAILKHIDVKEKTVLDLGCSGGYFSFRLSRIARQVVAIDGDKEIIEHNREIAIKYGYSNINFMHAQINADLMESLPVFDITLFLSVFHHMLTASDAYDWNRVDAQSKAFESLIVIRRRSKILVFEMGYPNEGYEWCERLPEMLPTPQDWIIRNVFGTDFDKVRVISSPAYDGILGTLRRLVAHRSIANPTLKRIIRRLFSLDCRDDRDIFIGMRNPESP